MTKSECLATGLCSKTVLSTSNQHCILYSMLCGGVSVWSVSSLPYIQQLCILCLYLMPYRLLLLYSLFILQLNHFISRYLSRQ